MEKTENNIAQRLKSLIGALGLTDSQFADQCEISRATLSLLLSGKNKKISDVLLSQIHSAFPQVSIIWLLFDEGEMFQNTSGLSQDQSEELTGNDNNLFEDNLTENNNFQNLMPVNLLEKTIKHTVLKAFESFLEDNGFSKGKNTDMTNRKRVRQITVYYEDSTFETFMPQ